MLKNKPSITREIIIVYAFRSQSILDHLFIEFLELRLNIRDCAIFRDIDSHQRVEATCHYRSYV